MSERAQSKLNFARLRAAPAPEASLGDGPALRNRRPWWRGSSLPAALSLAAAMMSNLTAQAGDLLRGGSSATTIGGKGAGRSLTASGTSQAAANAKDALARTTQALQAVQSMQAAARKVALAGPPSVGKALPSVPNGLVPGGLQVAAGVPVNLSKPVAGENAALWQGALLPKQTVSQGEVTVDIVQTKPTAILTWATFNVGKQTTVVFDQSAGGSDTSKWIALNRVTSTGIPSQILGSIKASGQVYIINPNGIIFGGSSQINVHTLVASALPINDNLVNRGLLNNPDQQFLFSTTALPSGTVTPAFVPNVTDPAFTVSDTTPTYALSQVVATGSTPVVRLAFSSPSAPSLVSGTDYTSVTDANKKTTLTFTAAGLAKIAGGPVTVSYLSASMRYGDVVVQAGANITSPTTAAHVGGRVALIGANVSNAGTISTPDGQTILAAGLQVGMAAHASNDASLRGLDVYVGAVADPVSVLKPYAGTATNTGLIDAPRADVTVTGKSVNQSGVIDSSTSVSLNGRIDLLAEYNALMNPKFNAVDPATIAPYFFQSSGTVTLGADSVSRILPEVSSTETVVGAQLALPSVANIQGQAIHFVAGSTLLAPNANVSAGAGIWKYTFNTSSTPPPFTVGDNSRESFVYSGGQVYLDAGASINVAGSSDVSAPVSENIISAQLLGPQLANSPLQRNGLLRGQTVQVDIRQTGIFNGFAWVGTPLGDVSGFLGLIQHNVGELTTNGGSVTLNAGSSVVMQPGSSINVSGGWIDYQGGVVQTTRVISQGVIYDISQATPDRVYDGIYTGTFAMAHPKYGLSETFTNPLALSGAHFEESYVQGANGGTISITAPSMALDGELLGNTVAGPRQRVVTPTASSLSLAFKAQQPELTGSTYVTYSPTPPDVIFKPGANLPPADPFAVDASGQPAALLAVRQKEVVLSPELTTTDGFGTLVIDDPDGNIIVPENVTLTSSAERSSPKRTATGALVTVAGNAVTVPGGNFTFNAANLDIEGNVLAPGGSLSFNIYNISPAILAKAAATGLPLKATPPASPGRGNFTLGATASLNTAGLIVDDRPSAPAPESLPFTTNGGSVGISTYNADLVAGSSIDVSGGIAISPTGKKTYGNGGGISISAGQDPTVTSLLGGKLTLDASLKGFSGATGGTLNILAPMVQVGGVAKNPGVLLLDPSFFSQGGFASFSLTGLGESVGKIGDPNFLPAIVIAPDTTIAPVVESSLYTPGPGSGGDVVLTPTLLPEGQRSPVSLSFNAPGVVDFVTGAPVVRGDIVMGAGALIKTDARGGVSFSGNTVSVLGSVIAPAGSISITGAKDSNPLFAGQPNALVTVYLGPQSLLSTAGTTIFTPEVHGFVGGSVLPGGTIMVSGNIVVASGAVLDVSGTSGILDLPPVLSTLNPVSTGPSPAGMGGALHGSFLGAPLVPTRVDSNGGSITLQGGQELFSDATLLGAPGGPSALGGSLTVSSGRFVPPDSAQLLTPLDVTLEVSQSGPVAPVPLSTIGGSAIGSTVLGLDGKPLLGIGHLAVSSFSQGGFDSVTLRGTVKFSGPVSISVPGNLTVADAGVIFADSPTTLSAPHITLGKPFQPPNLPQDPVSQFLDSAGDAFHFSPSYGSGKLTIVGSLIDIGNLSLQSIGEADFIAAGGDIRGDGTLDVAGHIALTAGQIYPPSAVQFTIAAYDYKVDGKNHLGSVTINASGNRQLPLSAGGTLSVYGSIIDQHGVLRAPIGTINLGWDGTGTGPVDLITGKAVATTQQLTLAAGSVTSVSAVDPLSGQGMLIPYGINPNGTSWIDPTGTDITASGVPGKTVNLAAVKISDQARSLIDTSGGGDLYAYRFVAGTTGTNDILASTSSFAVIPGYQADYAPFAPFNPSPNAIGLASDPGYVASGLKVGDRITLGASAGLPAGVYTLLPARYALLPGAFLVTPEAGMPVGTQAMPDGTTIVSGYRFNDLNPGGSTQPLIARFEIDSAEILRNRAQYIDFSGNTFLYQGAIQNNVAIPRLPMDAGQLVLTATAALSLKGQVNAHAAVGGQGGLVDISSPVDILISGSTGTTKAGSLVLDASELSAFGADSLLIGGVRHFGTNGVSVAVQTGNITVDNSGSPLSGPDVILVANKSLTLAPGAEIESSGTLSGGAEPLLLGNSAVKGSGDGLLLRVSSDSSARVFRSGVDPTATVSMTVGAGAKIAGAGLILDSTNGTSLDSSVVLDGQSITLDSGQISIQLANPGALQPTTGMVIAGQVLQDLQAAQNVSLLSYSSIDIYGTGQIGAPTLASLALHAAEIRGFNADGGVASFAAHTISLDNSPGQAALGSIAPLDGTLNFNSTTFSLGAHQVALDQYANVGINAPGGMVVHGNGGLSTQGALSITAGAVVAAKGADQTITAAGDLEIQAPAGFSRSGLSSGLGASLTFVGATITETSNISLPSGVLTLHATAGELSVGGRLDVGGTAQSFFDLIRYTDAGQITLISDTGGVDVASGGTLSVSAQPGGGNAGSISISAPHGTFSLEGKIDGHAAAGQGGMFTLDAGNLPGGSVDPLDAVLDKGGFNRSISIRDRNDAVVSLTGTAKSHSYSLSADHGSIDITGEIDASGATGGTIDLVASGSVTLESGAKLTVAGDDFDHAGKGGAVSLEAGSETNGTFDTTASVSILAGSTIDLTVASNTAGSAASGDFTGTLHLRAPQTSGNTDLQINAIDGSILGASNIVVEGYTIFNPVGGTISSALQSSVKANGNLFTGNTAAITDRLLANNGGSGGVLGSVLSIEPGAEVINPTGNLTLSADWDLSSFRFGAKGVPGVLTLRAFGNLIFNGTLNDGFASSANTAALLAQNPLLPGNGQSWTYRLVAGADLGAADFHQVRPLAGIATSSGSLQLGKDDGLGIANPSGANASTSKALVGHYQVIRTGSGDIDISVGRDVQLLNTFATIYTAGTKVLDPTMGGTFDVPVLLLNIQGSLGAVQELPYYPVQYSFGGGNVTIAAQGNIEHETKNTAGVLVPDSDRELPMNWLYRRGDVNSLTGQFTIGKNKDITSTTWWVDFSNFFEGVGALGGGNVTMTAGQDISNVDALVPTNARMPKGTPNAAGLVELGGGDLFVHAGHDIDGGVYYVERGNGMLTAGNSIHTNSTRSPSLAGIISLSPDNTPAPEAWLPTTLFLGKGAFEVFAVRDLTLGPVANPFLLPEGVSNTFWNKSYFSTYAPTDAVSVSSLTGTLTLRESATLPGDNGATPLLEAWLQKVSVFTTQASTVSNYQPWLRLDELSVAPFFTVAALLPPTLQATAFSGDINIDGNLTLSPSPKGTVNLAAGGSINGLQPNGVTGIGGAPTKTWASAIINLSDTNPDFIPGIASPLSLTAPFPPSNISTGPWALTDAKLMDGVNLHFLESGATEGVQDVLQTKQALHAPGVLHSGDTDPLRLYAEGGAISGITLFSPKAARVLASGDITDVALYIQNTDPSDVTVVSAGRDIIAFDPNSPLRIASQALGNILDSANQTLAGDIQISGPGTLEVLAGRNLALGIGTSNSDGTAVGIASVGNARNPGLPFAGADIIAGAGVGGAGGLEGGALDFGTFIEQFVKGGAGQRYLSELSAGSAPGTTLSASSFNQLTPAQQDILALDVFYLVLRDAGRDHNATGAPFDSAFSAISALFPAGSVGSIDLTSREVKTKSGGNISLFAPGGQLTVGVDLAGNQPVDQGILTEDGGNISIFTDGNVNVGTSRIFTLRGGNEIIWSSHGNIAAGAASKTVQSAPPTRVLVDPQSGDVQTDLAGLATGGGIGVLETVAGVPPGDVDLIAATGIIDAGDAGIRVSGNLSLAAVQVLNAGNIQVAGTSVGAPSAPTITAPNLGGLAAASNTQGAGSKAADDVAKQSHTEPQQEEQPSIITVEVVSYGGGEASPDATPPPQTNAGQPADNGAPADSGAAGDDDERRKKKGGSDDSSAEVR